MMEPLLYAGGLPGWTYLTMAFVLGTILGSFLDVCVCRLHTGKSINGRSQCLSCGKGLRWYELFPVLSYVSQLGRCRGCGSRISPRLLFMEVVTGGLFVAAAAVAGGLGEFVWLAAVLCVLLLITMYDYQHFIIPDEWTALLTVLTAGRLGYDWYAGAAPSAIGWTILAAALGAAFLALVWAVTRGRALGFGDVKLAVPLGLWVGAASVFSFHVLSFWVGAVISLGILAYQRGKPSLHLTQETLTMKSAVPFAPFMIAGAVLVYFFDINVLSLFSFAN